MKAPGLFDTLRTYTRDDWRDCAIGLAIIIAGACILPFLAALSEGPKP